MASVGTHETELFDLQRRLVILRAGLLLVVALLGLRLWHLQVREGPYYRDLSENNRTRSVILEPARGLIYDRHGVLLANNVPSFSLYVTLEDVKDLEGLVATLATLLNLDSEFIQKKLSSGKGGKLLPRKVKDRLTLREATIIESHRLAPFQPLRDYRVQDLMVRREAAHSVWDGVVEDELTFRRGVAGFYGRGWHQPPDGATVIHSIGTGRHPVDFVDRVGAGRVRFHGGTALWPDAGATDTTGRIVPQLLDWLFLTEMQS